MSKYKYRERRLWLQKKGRETRGRHLATIGPPPRAVVSFGSPFPQQQASHASLTRSANPCQATLRPYVIAILCTAPPRRSEQSQPPPQQPRDPHPCPPRGPPRTVGFLLCSLQCRHALTVAPCVYPPRADLRRPRSEPCRRLRANHCRRRRARGWRRWVQCFTDGDLLVSVRWRVEGGEQTFWFILFNSILEHKYIIYTSYIQHNTAQLQLWLQMPFNIQTDTY